MRAWIWGVDGLAPKLSWIVASFVGAIGLAAAQSINPPPLDFLQPPLLSQVSRALPPAASLAMYVNDRTAALQLGKALFWDMQLGSDGFTACASCHYHAGADPRSKNQVNPGVLAFPPDSTFAPQLGAAPNRQLTLADFPLHRLADPDDPSSAVLSDSNDVVSSQGIHFGIFVDGISGQAADVVKPMPDPDGFLIGTVNVRRVEPRNTPTIINAVFNKVLFWDGRAKAVFNGVDSSGVAKTLVYRADKNQQLVAVAVQLPNSPLASQSLSPPLSAFEMSASGRPFREIGQRFLRSKGKRLRGLNPLAKQIVHPLDSVLGSYSASPKPGLQISTYDALIRKAFKKDWWQSNQRIEVDSQGNPTVRYGAADPRNPNQYDLMDWNFPLFFGLAIQEYLATLVDGDSPFDRFQRGDTKALSTQQLSGLRLFLDSDCHSCHSLPEFTLAAVGQRDQGNGFRTIGVRPFWEDPGIGGGAFKIPTLRNVELTAPYMHNGGMATLAEVVDFYNRGRSDFGIDQGGAVSSLPLSLTAAQKADLIAFLKALTDDRVRFQRAPFDHPQLFVPNGHPMNQNYVRANANGNAVDDVLLVPAVGRNGGPDITPKSFLQAQ